MTISTKPAAMPYTIDMERIRSDFPILKRQIKPGVPLVYLDSAASSQKPDSVIDAMSEYYRNHHANIHRGVHTLAEEATSMYEAARGKVAAFLRAQPKEIIFTRNATEAINLVAHSWARHFLHAGDRILLTEMEHHSNLVPWQILAKERDLQLDFITLTGSGELDLDAYEQSLARGPKLIALTQMSNVLGTIVPIRDVVRSAHRAGALVLVDAAQSAPHLAIDVKELDVDFLALSAHKMCGPTGIGALYGRTSLLREMPPFLGGGDMIRKVDWRTFEPNDLPYTFEAGKRGGLVSFTLEGIHPHDIAQILDSRGIAVRAGHHCAMPLHVKLGLSATTRASFYLYTTYEEIDALISGLHKARALFA
jgi:cysteine desulfurase/selenocysteine lyase